MYIEQTHMDRFSTIKALFETINNCIRQIKEEKKENQQQMLVFY